jgi:peptide-methionine (S)-S-oxide reductase
MSNADRHFVLGSSIRPPFPAACEQAQFGMGCFWGAERCFWTLPGVHTTAAGYAGGRTANPSYQEVCTGTTGHAEVVFVVYDPARIEFMQLLQTFWESHDPTQGMRQGADVGSQYRSMIATHSAEQLEEAQRSRTHYQARLANKRPAKITTEVASALEFYYAEDYHQQYLAKNPAGYCGLGGCGVSYQ